MPTDTGAPASGTGSCPTGQAPSGLDASRGDPSRDFLIKRWCIAVDGYGTGRYDAVSRGKALADAWRCDAFSNVTFGQFMRMARCWRDHDVPPRWGEQIIVGGKPAFFLENNRQYVRFAYPGGAYVSNAHPYDVLPVAYRPDTYRDRDTDGSPEGRDAQQLDGVAATAGAVTDGIAKEQGLSLGKTGSAGVGEG